MKFKNTAELKQFTSSPFWYSVRASVMMFFGAVIAALCLIAPDVHILGERFSWIPVIGFIVLFLGVLRCIDAFTSESLQGFLLNMQGGVLDIVVGFLVLFSINDGPEYLTLLVAGYMLTQGILRNILLSVVTIENPKSSRVTGLISIALGFLIWLEWPAAAPWFLAFSLSVDVGFRGWALMMLASSLRKHVEQDIS